MKSIQWTGEELILLDQTLLPNTTKYIYYKDWREVAEAIKSLRVRGAPAIGVAGAYAVVLLAQELSLAHTHYADFVQALREDCLILKQTRPTAVNLAWAVDEVLQVLPQKASISSALILLEEKAKEIEKEDILLCEAIAKEGIKLFIEKESYSILTHCNTGSLATAGIGTALGIIRTLAKHGKVNMVYADETRPLLQGSRLTAYELTEEGVPCKLITDSMAAFVMRNKLIDAIIVGADRITRNGDVANKIGTYGLAVLAKAHNIPFYVAAPFSTFDMSMKDGREIPIEYREAEEILKIQNNYIAPQKVEVLNPAFDITPNFLISGIITERGVILEPTEERILEMYGNIE